MVSVSIEIIYLKISNIPHPVLNFPFSRRCRHKTYMSALGWGSSRRESKFSERSTLSFGRGSGLPGKA